MSRYILILTTVNSWERAKEIALRLIEEKLSACVTISSLATSFYRWKGKINEEKEYIVFIKSKKEIYNYIEERVKELHPYEIPEIIALPIEKGLKEYLTWIDNEVF